MALFLAITSMLLVAAVGFIRPSAAAQDIMSTWKRYGGDMEIAESASVMVFCSCDLTIVGLCNITMAAEFYPQDEPECHGICGGRVECAYCDEPGCQCSEVESYHLCQSGNRAKLVQCSKDRCTSSDAEPMCQCELIIVKPHGTTEAPLTVATPATDNMAFNHGLLTGLKVGGCILLFLVIIAMALVIVAVRRRNMDRLSMTRTNTNSSAAPMTSQDGLKGVNNPTYEGGNSTLPGIPASPSTTSYLYPYAPRLTANRQMSTSDGASPQTSTQASPYYQEIMLREEDQPPTYEDSEGYTRYRTQPAQADAGTERRQPVYMELVRPSDRTTRPPVDTYMY